jgi:hypothetical protein
MGPTQRELLEAALRDTYLCSAECPQNGNGEERWRRKDDAQRSTPEGKKWSPSGEDKGLMTTLLLGAGFCRAGL